MENHHADENSSVDCTGIVDLGNILKSFRNTHEKLDFLKTGKAIRKALYGDNHYLIATTLMNFSQVHGDLGDVQKQKRYLKRAFRMLVGVHIPPEHRESVALQIAVCSKKFVDICSYSKQLDAIYVRLKDTNQIMTLLEEMTNTQAKRYGSNSLQLAAIFVQIGDVCRVLGEAYAEIGALEKALRLLRSRYSLQDHRIKSILNKLDIAYQFLEKQPCGEEALLQVLHKTVSTRLKYCGPGDLLANILGKLGDFYLCSKSKPPTKEGDLLKLEEGIIAQGWFCPDQQFHSEEEIEEPLSALRGLAKAYGYSKNHEKQLLLLRRLLAMQENYYGATDINLTATLGHLASNYYKLEQHHEARLAAQRARAISAKYAELAEEAAKGISDAKLPPISGLQSQQVFMPAPKKKEGKQNPATSLRALKKTR